MEFLAPDGKRAVLRGMPNEASGSATTKRMTNIFRHEDKNRTRKWPTPLHKTSRKDQWYEKGFPNRPPYKRMMPPREFGRASNLGCSIPTSTQEDTRREYRAWVRRNINSKKKKSHLAVE